jgi:hypothetical protein
MPGLKTDFAGSERVKNLWNSLVEFHIQNGGNRAELERRVNVGYPTGCFLPLGETRNNKLFLEGPEVVEFAYSDERYYHLLHKHGFPVPFAMSDFDESTDVDAKWKKKICDGADRIKRDFIREKGSPKAGSDEYQRELAQRVFAFMRPLLDWEDDRSIASDWEALERRRGVCVNASAALYFAYRRVGLNPTFLVLKDVRPTIDRLTMFEQVAGPSDHHVLIGVPLKDGGMLQVDPILGMFDFDFQYTKVLSPRQFTVASLNNAINWGERSRRIRVLRLQQDLAPDEPETYFNTLLADIKALDRDAFDQRVKEMYHRFGRTPVVDYYVTKLRLHYDGMHEPKREVVARRQKEFFDALDALCADDPQSGSYALFVTAYGMLTASEKDYESSKNDKGDAYSQALAERRLQAARMLTYKMAWQSVLLNPYYHSSVRFLHQVAQSALEPLGIVELYEKLVEKFPEHSHFRWRLAEAYYQAGGHVQDVPEGVSYLEKAFAQAKMLAEKLEPNRPEVHMVLGFAAMMLGKSKLAMKSLNRARELLPEKANIERELLGTMVIVGLQNGDADYMNKALGTYADRYADTWASELAWAMLRTNFDIGAGPDGEKVEPAELTRRVSMMLGLFDRIAKDVDDRITLERALVKWTVIIFVASKGDDELVDQLVKRIEDVNKDHVQEAFVVLIEQLVLPILETGEISEKGPKLAERCLRYLGGQLKPKHRLSLIPCYAQLARRAIVRGKKAMADRVFETAFKIDPQKGPDRYFDVVIREFYTHLQDEKIPAAERIKSHGKMLDALDILWRRRARLSEQMIDKLQMGYELTGQLLQELGVKEGADLALRRAKILKKQ